MAANCYNLTSGQRLQLLPIYFDVTKSGSIQGSLWQYLKTDLTSQWWPRDCVVKGVTETDCPDRG